MRVEIEQIPTYRVKTGQSFYDCPSSTYIGSEEEVEWEGAPNENFEPLNEAAVIEMDRFYAYVDSLPRPKNQAAQGQDIGQAIISAMKQMMTERSNPPAPLMNVSAAATELGIDPAALMKALGISGVPGEVGGFQRVEPPEYEVPVRPRRATIASAEPDDVTLDTRARVAEPTHIKRLEPKPKNKVGRPRKIPAPNALSQALADAG